MPRFKVEVTRLTPYTVTLDAVDAQEAQDTVEDFYSEEFDPLSRDDDGYLEFHEARVHIQEGAAEFQVHEPEEVLE